MGVSELRELRQLREENRQLKRLVADLTLDKHILQEVLSEKSEAGSEAGAGWSDKRMVRHRCEEGLRAPWDTQIGLLLPEPGACADRAEDAVARAGDDAGEVWVQAVDDPAQAGGLAGQPQAGVPALQGDGADGSVEAPTEDRKPWARGRIDSCSRCERALEHGLRDGPVRERQVLPDPDADGHPHAGVSYPGACGVDDGPEGGGSP